MHVYEYHHQQVYMYSSMSTKTFKNCETATSFALYETTSVRITYIVQSL